MHHLLKVDNCLCGFEHLEMLFWDNEDGDGFSHKSICWKSKHVHKLNIKEPPMQVSIEANILQEIEYISKQQQPFMGALDLSNIHRLATTALQSASLSPYNNLGVQSMSQAHLTFYPPPPTVTNELNYLIGLMTGSSVSKVGCDLRAATNVLSYGVAQLWPDTDGALPHGFAAKLTLSKEEKIAILQGAALGQQTAVQGFGLNWLVIAQIAFEIIQKLLAGQPVA